MGPLPATSPESNPNHPGVLGFYSQIDPFSAQTSLVDSIETLLSGGEITPMDIPVTEALDPSRTAELFQSAVADPLLRTFDRDIAPRIRDEFAGQGATFSTRRGEASRRALEDLQSNLASQLATAQMRNQLSQAEIETQTNLHQAGLNANLQQTGIDARRAGIEGGFQLERLPLQQTLGLSAGLLPYQAMAQQQLDRQYDEFNRLDPANNPFTGLSNQFTGQNQAQLTSKSDPYGPMLAEMAGGITTMGAYKAFGGFDRPAYDPNYTGF
jgi:hypothetical protein